MRKWQHRYAQYQFLEIMTACAQEPQMITNNNQILGVVIDGMRLIKFTELWKRHHQPTMAELLEELE